MRIYNWSVIVTKWEDVNHVDSVKDKEHLELLAFFNSDSTAQYNGNMNPQIEYINKLK